MIPAPKTEKSFTKKIVRYKYTPLMVFQLVLMILYFMFVTFPKKPEEKVKTEKCYGFAGTHVMVFFGFGFLMTFPRRYCYSAIGYNLVLAAMAAQWALLCQNYFHLTNGSIIMSKKLLIKADMMATTVLITFGALLGLVSDLQLLFIAIVEIVVACGNSHILSDIFMAADAGGSMAIHTFGAYFGLGISMALRNRKEAPDRPKGSLPLHGPNYLSDVTATLGCLFMYVYWPYFNSAITDHYEATNRAIAHSYTSLVSAGLVSFFLSVITSKEAKVNMVHVRNSMVAGGVAIGSCSIMIIGYGVVALIGIGASLLCVLGNKYMAPCLEKMNILDTCGVNNVHGMPGVFSGLISAVLAFVTGPWMEPYDYPTIFPAMVLKRRSPMDQALYQLYGLATTLVLALGGGYVTVLLSDVRVLKPVEPRRRFDDKYNWELPETKSNN